MSEVSYYILKPLVNWPKCLHITIKKVIIKEIMSCWKMCSFAGKAALLRFFCETKEITLYKGTFFQVFKKTHEIECKMPLYSQKTVIRD